MFRAILGFSILPGIALAQISGPFPGSPTRRDPVPIPVRFAVIGDYGSGTANEADVAARVASWSPQFIVTVGDNNYPLGEQSTIDDHIGQFYSAFIHPYVGIYGPGATENRFFPCLGNQDWYTAGAVPYLGYFTLPGNERTYDFVRGPIHFFMIDSDANEPDGITSTSLQAQWLRNRLALSGRPSTSSCSTTQPTPPAAATARRSISNGPSVRGARTSSSPGTTTTTSG